MASPRARGVRLELRFLGGFDARLSAGERISLPTAKSRALLAYLASPPDRLHLREKLATLLWGEVSDERARDSLRHALAGLRNALRGIPEILTIESSNIGVTADGVSVDVVDFERAVARGTPADLEAAAALYSGDFLEGLGVGAPLFDEWMMEQRERLRSLAIDALQAFAAHLERNDAVEPAIAAVRRALSLDPLAETAHRRLMTIYARRGRRAEMLRQYEVCADVLRRELGTTPADETTRLRDELLRSTSAPAPATTRAAASTAINYAPEPLVGRETELAHLRQVLDEVLHGCSAAVAIRGEAGIGKSRVVAELARESVRRGARVAIGRCSESEHILPLAPWATALRSLPIDAGVTARLGAVWIAELARLLPELTPASPIAPMAGETSLRLFDAVWHALAAIAEDTPVVLVLEDAHWSDEMSLRLFSYISRRLGRSRVLLVLTTREPHDAPAVTRVLQESEARSVVLGPLSRDQIDRLVGARLRVHADRRALAQIAESVWATSEGNPFVAIECIRAVNTEGDAGRTVLPLKVRELIHQRLAPLDATSRLLLDIAAIAGDLDFDVLQRASGIDRAVAAMSLERLVAQQLLLTSGDSFMFTHDRVRVAVHDAILPVRRRLLHGAVGDALEACHTDRLAEVSDRLIHHFVESDRHDKAVTYLARAAETAALRHAHQDAVASLDSALEHARRLPAPDQRAATVSLLPAFARSFFALGRIGDALTMLRTHEATVHEAAVPLVRCAVLFWRGYFENIAGNHAQAVAFLQEARAEALRADDSTTGGLAEYELARGSFWSGRPGDGVRHGREAIRLLEATGEQWWLGLAYWVVGINYGVLGEFSEALTAESRALELADIVGDALLRSYALFTSGWVHAMRGDVATAISLCEEALTIAPDPLTRAQALAMLGFAHLEAGNPHAAVERLRAAIEPVRPFRPGHAWFTVMLADAHMLQQDWGVARALFETALQLSRESQFALGAALAMRGFGRIAVRERAPVEARRWLTLAIEAMAAIEARVEAERTRRELGDLLNAEGSSP